MNEVRLSLRQELESRGFDVAGDTVASRGQIYVKADGDLAAGVFEFHETVLEAVETMYQGRWTEGLPPRFVVLPAAAAEDESFELLEQMRIIPVLYEMAGDAIVFCDLEERLGHLG